LAPHTLKRRFAIAKCDQQVITDSKCIYIYQIHQGLALYLIYNKYCHRKNFIYLYFFSTNCGGDPHSNKNSFYKIKAQSAGRILLIVHKQMCWVGAELLDTYMFRMRMGRL
jgi:hypothetical protein